MTLWRVVVLMCIAFIFVEARTSETTKRETQSQLCDPTYKNTNKIRCYCTKDSSHEIVKTAECLTTVDDIPSDDVTWNVFTELKNVSKLTFMSTTAILKYVPQHALMHTEKVLKIELKYGNIEIVQPFAFANLSEVKEIILSDNQIKALKVNAFAHHKNLEVISLDMNALVEINRDVFVDLPALDKLYLTSNKITIIHDKSFIHLSNLKELEIDRNNLFSLNSDTFSGLSKLQKLDISGNALEVIGDNTFLPLKNLRTLNLEGNKIQMLDPKSFHGLYKLQTLSLASNELSNIANEKVFDGLESLTILSLKANQLTSLKPEVMAPIVSNFYNNASSLDVEDNNFPCDCQLDWFIVLINKTRSSHLKLATENLKCAPNSDVRDKWNKVVEAEKNMQEIDNGAVEDYDYYDDSQLNGKLFYVDMRYLLNCSNLYNGEVINISSIIVVPTTEKQVAKLPAIVRTSPNEPLNQNDKPKPKKMVDTTELPNLLMGEKPIYTTSRLATVSAKYDKVDERNMASDQAKPDEIKAYRSIQTEDVEKSANSAENMSSLSMFSITLYVAFSIM